MAATDYNIINNFRGVGQALKEAQAQAANEQIRQIQLVKALRPELPANVREYQMIQSLPADQQKAYFDFLKAKTPNYGGEFTLPSPQPITQPAPQPTPQPTTAPAPQPAKPTQAVNVPPPLPDFQVKNTGKQSAIFPQITENIDQPNPVTPEAPKPIFYQNARGEYDTKGAPEGMAWANVNGRRVATPIPGVKPKLSASQQKEIFDTLDVINNSNSALEVLKRAENLLQGKLGATPYSGKGSQTLATINAIPGLGLAINDEKASATEEYNTLIKEQALQTMKAIFGGNPTEGERQVLLDIQAISSKTPQAQQRILDNAKRAISRRIEFGSNKIKAIEEGTPYSQLVPTNNNNEEPPTNTTPKMGTVEDGYIFLGGNPADPKRWKKK